MKTSKFMTLMSLIVLSCFLLCSCGSKKETQAVSPVETIAGSAASSALSAGDASVKTGAASSDDAAAAAGVSSSSAAAPAAGSAGSAQATDKSETILTKAGEAALTIRQKAAKPGPGKRVYAPESSAASAVTESAGSAGNPSSSASSASAPAAPSAPVVLPATGNAADSSIAFRVDLDIAEAPVPYAAGFAVTEKQVEAQLDELASYWEKYHLDSVDYLVRLPRFRYISQQLSGTNDFYYSGETLPDGTPHGLGIAVYSDNRYYYGRFANGLREGDGTWIQIFTRGGAYSKKNNGIYYHSYAGDFRDDLPDGEGQEHISHDPQYQTRRIATNVIGNFKSGYYHGEEYILTVDTDGSQKDWSGKAFGGTWLAAADDYVRRTDGEMPVARNMNEPGDYIWMTAANNRKQGVTGLVNE